MAWCCSGVLALLIASSDKPGGSVSAAGAPARAPRSAAEARAMVRYRVLISPPRRWLPGTICMKRKQGACRPIGEPASNEEHKQFANGRQRRHAVSHV